MHSYKKRANFYVSYFWSLNRVSTTRKRFVHVPNGKQMVQCLTNMIVLHTVGLLTADENCDSLWLR